MSEPSPIRLVPLAERDRQQNRERMLRHLEFYRKAIEAGEIDQIGIVATYRDGTASTSSVELPGHRVKLIGTMHIWLHRITHGYLDDDWNPR